MSLVNHAQDPLFFRKTQKHTLSHKTICLVCSNIANGLIWHFIWKGFTLETQFVLECWVKARKIKG